MNFKDLLRRWRALIHRDELDQELDEELRFHLDRLTEQNIKNGMSPEDARHAALKTFSRVDQSKEECRDARGVGLLENILRDASYSLRILIKNYAFTIVVIATLAPSTRPSWAPVISTPSPRSSVAGIHRPLH